MKIINFIAICLGLFTSCTTLHRVNNETVESFDLNRYLGQWYEIARFNHIFERGMDHNKAEYTLCDDGMISVTNTALKNGQEKIVKGVAKTTDIPGLLRVSFFKPFYGDYRVLYIDADYQYALIGSKGSGYLWILSRTPLLNDTAKYTLLTEATRRGYNIDMFIWVNQE